jgi:hypothetical protein
MDHLLWSIVKHKLFQQLLKSRRWLEIVVMLPPAPVIIVHEPPPVVDCYERVVVVPHKIWSVPALLVVGLALMLWTHHLLKLQGLLLIVHFKT